MTKFSDRIPVGHSRGPWKAGDRKDADGRQEIDAPCWDDLANVVVRMNGCAEDNPEGVANRDLILLAPEMADEIRRLEKVIEDPIPPMSFDLILDDTFDEELSKAREEQRSFGAHIQAEEGMRRMKRAAKKAISKALEERRAPKP